MPSPSRSLTAGDAFELVRDRALNGPDPQPLGPPLVGVELEWHTWWRNDPLGRVAPEELRAALTPVLPLPCGGLVTIEPGGQVELSTPPLPSIGAMLKAAHTDAAVLRAALAGAGIVTGAAGVDGTRAPRRVLGNSRYRAMEAFFEEWTPAGHTMMCNTASIHVNVGYGPDPAAQWRAAHIAAAGLGAVYGCDERRAVWDGIDPSRTVPVAGPEPGEAWARYALAARVMFVRTAPEWCEPVRWPLTFGEWLARGGSWGWPTVADLDEHLTTLFPPVRPRGWLEVRTLDMLPDDQWPAAVAMTAALLVDPAAVAEVDAAGPGLPADRLLSIGSDALDRLGLSELGVDNRAVGRLATPSSGWRRGRVSA